MYRERDVQLVLGPRKLSWPNARRLSLALQPTDAVNQIYTTSCRDPLPLASESHTFASAFVPKLFLTIIDKSNASRTHRLGRKCAFDTDCRAISPGPLCRCDVVIISLHLLALSEVCGCPSEDKVARGPEARDILMWKELSACLE